MAILGELNEEEGLLYQLDENGREQIIRSIESTRRVFLRYTNRTSRPVKVWWRDFTGYRQFYVCLKPTEFCDINTYFTHPWEFTDEATGERYRIGNNVIFRPPLPENNVRHRINWNISASLRSLRALALLKVAMSLRDKEQVAILGLPRQLTMEVEELVEVIRKSRLPGRDE